MKTRHVVAQVAVLVFAGQVLLGNGGPFVLKYPGGDPAAKGVLARLHPTLKPAREARLRVLKEDLAIDLTGRGRPAIRKGTPPVAGVEAAYTIENPTDEDIEVDFGFPILRGIYTSPFSMRPTPDVRVRVDGKAVKVDIISNSAIYGLIRQRARAVIDEGVAADANLAALVRRVRAACGPEAAQQQAARPAGRDGARKALADYLTGALKWKQRDAALMVEYASLDLGQARSYPRDRGIHYLYLGRDELSKLTQSNLGPLSAIGEQKATQLFAQLAGKFDREAASAYEEIFTAWGGDVRERAIDLTTGKVRPREISVEGVKPGAFGADPTIYARVDYLDPKAKITDAERTSCRTVLKNLPVVFTFAPMNLLHYRATFPAGKTRVVKVSYGQHLFADTAEPASYQLAYVVHPASLWEQFGPIHLTVRVPEGRAFRCTVPCKRDTRERDGADGKKATNVIYRATLEKAKQKTGELLVAISQAAPGEVAEVSAKPAAGAAPAAGRPIGK
jgi:hypothetical protein